MTGQKRDKRFEKRREQLLKAIDENPKDLDNHLILAKFYFVNECYPETIEAYKKLLQYYPRDTSILFNLAVAYQANKEIKEAQEIYLKILKIDPAHKEAQERLIKLATFK